MGSMFMLTGTLQLMKQQLSFFKAEVYCELHGGHLVSIHSQVENDLVHNLCDSGRHKKTFVEDKHV